MIISLVFWLSLCILTAVLANKRGRDPLGFFLLSVLLSPLIGFVAVLCVKDLSKEVPSVGIKKCPKCAEIIKKEALVCRFCGNEDFLKSDYPINPDLSEAHMESIRKLLDEEGFDYDELTEKILGENIPIQSLTPEQASMIIQSAYSTRN